jgi:hypothetical protein
MLRAVQVKEKTITKARGGNDLGRCPLSPVKMRQKTSRKNASLVTGHQIGTTGSLMFPFIEKYRFIPYKSATERAHSDRLIKRLVISARESGNDLMNKRIAEIGLLGIISFMLSFTFVRDALIDDRPLFPTLEYPG